MTTLPRLSIVIPSYNQGMFIERTILSIIDQDYPNLELILMDGGSTDDTMAIVERYKSHFAHIQSQPDGGQSAALVAGFVRATGDYISWLNSDDSYNPGALVAVGTYLAAHRSVAFVYGNMNYVDADDAVIAFKRTPAFNLGVMKYAFLTVAQQSAFWTRELYHQVGGIDPNLRFCMDYDLFVKMASVCAPVHIDVTIGNFRIHDTSKTSTLESVRRAEDRLIHSRYCRVKPTSRLAFAVVRKLYFIALCALTIANGSFVDRVKWRMRNGWKSAAS